MGARGPSDNSAVTATPAGNLEPAGNRRSYLYGEPEHVRQLRLERAELVKKLRYERQRVDAWRRRYGALQDQLRELRRNTSG